ncbi:ribonuclease P protein component [Pseudonocardiaceae bacterium YIM PH 21723]|nr:ribonuclease P protein component [Pseudonocardiaceae bacterium YIM PH 21723]
MLPAAARLHRPAEFSQVVRGGRRAGRQRVVVHALIRREPAGELHSTTPTWDASTSRVGFVVSKAVGGAVIRHRVTRRLRHLMVDRLAGLPAGTQVVVRALPASAAASSAELGADLDSALRKLLRGSS